MVESLLPDGSEIALNTNTKLDYIKNDEEERKVKLKGEAFFIPGDKEWSEGFEKLKEGVELVYEKFKSELGRLGVEPIEAIGHPFNENEHEALMQQPAPEDTAPGTVIDEIQKGYRMGERVLRHSRVVVAA